jgi:nitroreductase
MKSDVYTVLSSRRSVRRFQQKPVSLDVLQKCVDAGRLAPSAANLQPVQFILVTEKNLCTQFFETLHWAAYIKPEWMPSENERPVAYIVIVVEENASPWYVRDVSYAAGNIVHVAEAEGIGSCILCKIEKKQIKDLLSIPSEMVVDSVIALGYKAEQPVVEDLIDSVKYYRDSDEILHVPKRRLDTVLHMNGW